MRLARFPIDACDGLLLAHRHSCATGSIAKGTRLDLTILDRLRGAGQTHLICAAPDDGDVHEDQAADRLARALAPAGVDLDRAATGRVNIRVPVRGIVRYDRDVIRRLNEIDEAITFALVQHNQLLDAGQMAATLKIIPFFVAESSLAAIEECLGTGPGFSFHPLRQAKVALIQTRLAGQKDRLFTATEKVTAARLAQLDCQLVDSRICPHDRQPLAAAIKACKDVDIILLCGASAIADRQDELPQAVVLAGGQIDRFGLPVDPGNLLMLAHLGSGATATPVIGMPGCARSPKLNGLDWVLQLVLADIDVTTAECADMAAGGLLMEIASRPMPRALATRHLVGDHVVGILLAAGQSRRMGAVNKLLAPLAGKPLVRHAAEAMLAAGLDEVIVVVGHEADKVAAALDGLPVRPVFNPHHASGQATSVATGIGALAADVSDVMIGLGDMPLLTADMMDRLLRAHLDQADHHRRITMPLVGGKRGNPVVWGRAFFPELAALSGDSGGRQLLADHIAAHNLVISDEAGWLQDVDTVDALAALDH